MGNQMVCCQQYYCHDVLLKPEWFSENSWNISYDGSEKPYQIENGVVKIKNQKSAGSILFSKKLLVDLEVLEKFTFPLQLQYNMNHEWLIYIFFSNQSHIINDLEMIRQKKMDGFLFQLKMFRHKIYINRSHEPELFQKKIKNSEKPIQYKLELNHMDNTFFIDESLTIYSMNKYRKKTHKIFEHSDIYLNIFIVLKNEQKENEYIQLEIC